MDDDLPVHREKDVRDKICDILSDMFNNVDAYGIFPTTTAYERLEKLIAEEVAKHKGE